MELEKRVPLPTVIAECISMRIALALKLLGTSLIQLCMIGINQLANHTHSHTMETVFDDTCLFLRDDSDNIPLFDSKLIHTISLVVFNDKKVLKKASYRKPGLCYQCGLYHSWALLGTYSVQNARVIYIYTVLRTLFVISTLEMYS